MDRYWNKKTQNTKGMTMSMTPIQAFELPIHGLLSHAFKSMLGRFGFSPLSYCEKLNVEVDVSPKIMRSLLASLPDGVMPFKKLKGYADELYIGEIKYPYAFEDNIIELTIPYSVAVVPAELVPEDYVCYNLSMDQTVNGLFQCFCSIYN